jgi:hypothetical protein
MRRLEAVLKALVDRVSPGDVRLNVSRAAWMRDGTSYEVSLQTRSFDEITSGETIGEAIRMALDVLEQPPVEGDTDPFVPSWYRVTRMQRELVERTLERCHAKHMARAAAANIAHAAAVAQAEYAMADAFKAALASLEFEDTDGHQEALEKEPLAARDPDSPIVSKSEAVERNDGSSRKEREARLAATVAELRAKNQARAKAGGPKRTK